MPNELEKPQAQAQESQETQDQTNDAEIPSLKFSTAEETSMLAESNRLKSTANALFSAARYSEAIGEYDKALSQLPAYFDYEISVLKSNVAACHLKLGDWKAAVESATISLEASARLLPSATLGSKQREKMTTTTMNAGGGAGHVEGKDVSGKDVNGGVIVELEGDNDEQVEEKLRSLELDDRRREDVNRIKAKALLRRAKAKTEQGGWANLAGAEEDYKELASMPLLPERDQKAVRRALMELPPRIKTAKEHEMGEMMGKLKDLGNGLLKPFGLSTDMFKLNKDEASGGYSMAFESGNQAG